jgi:thioredoxin 1
MAGLKQIGDDTFEQEVMKSSGLTIVDFNAPWCGPCKKLTPILKELSGEYAGQVKVVEVDVGEAPQTATRFGVISIPQVLFIRDGVVKESMVGLIPKQKLASKIEQYLA